MLQMKTERVPQSHPPAHGPPPLRLPPRADENCGSRRVSRDEDQDWNDDAWGVCKSDMLIKGAKIDKLPAETREHIVGQLREKARPGALKNRDAFDAWLQHALPGDQHVTKSLRVLLCDAFGEREEKAEICIDARGKPEPDSELRDTENVPLKEKVEDYFQREVLPHVLDAWIDENETKIGYEIPLKRHFYRYKPPRLLEEIEADIKDFFFKIVSRIAPWAFGCGPVRARQQPCVHWTGESETPSGHLAHRASRDSTQGGSGGPCP